MSFVKGLAKGFIRSAVNQVGRDGGKVISNQVYGNKHSTPLRYASDSVSETPAYIEETSQDYKPVYYESTFGHNIVMLLGSIAIPILGPLYWVLVASRNLFKTNMRYYTIEHEPVYVSDRRFKVGVRQTGVRPVKHFHDSENSPSGSERLFFIGKGIFALLLCLSILYLQYMMYLVFKESILE